jgi:hypothetical protein
MRRVLFVPLIVLLTGLAGCGGSGGGITPPPPMGNFSNASLYGQYAFSMNGVEAVSGAYVARIGSFSANGKGQITAGLEDVLNLSTGEAPSLIPLANGTYQIQENGRGIMTLYTTTGASLQLSFSLSSNDQGFLVQTDENAATSGSFHLQTPADFSTNAINGKYVFDFSGISFAGAAPSPISIIGQLATDGQGTVTGGTIDVNDGAFMPSGATPVAPDTYQIDTNGNGTNFGRGMLSFNGRTFAFYIVDNSRVEFLEEDALGGTAGQGVLQTGAIPTQNSQFMGSYILLTAGAATTGKFGPDGRAGRYTADGAGGIGSISFDDNNNGNYTHVSSGVSETSYAIDTKNAGSGRGTFTFKSSSLGTLSYVFYLSSPTQAVVQDVSAGIVGDGPMLAQIAGPFTNTSVAGNYILLWDGEQIINPSSFLEEFVGQFIQSTATSSNLTGTVDYIELGLDQSNSGATLNAGISGTLSINGDGTLNNGYKIAVGGTSPFTINFVTYFADNGTALMLCSDSNRTTAGQIVQQAE